MAAAELELPRSSSSVGVATYRVWVHSEIAVGAENKNFGDVHICLHGALGSVWLEQLQACQPSSGRLFQSATSSNASSERCEIYVSAAEVGTLYRITVAYAHGENDTHCRPWKLAQVVVRHGTDGMVYAFPAQCELKGPKALLELLPKHSWHEDLFGNCAEMPPPVPEQGQWRWPAPPRLVPSVGGDDAQLRREHDAMQLAIYRAVCEEEVLPLIDAALHDLAMQRTPGTFLHRCVQAGVGRAAEAEPKPAAKSAAKAPAPSAASKSSSAELEMHREQIRKLEAEKAALEAKAREHRQLLIERSTSVKGGRSTESQACILL